MVSFKGAHFTKDINLTCVRWYVAYSLSYRQVEERMQERGVSVDHATSNRWVLKYSPQPEAAFHCRKRPVWISWRMDETSVKVKHQWRYLYRAVDKSGQTIDFLLMEERDEPAAMHLLTRAIRRDNKAHGTAIIIRQGKYSHSIGLCGGAPVPSLSP
jgi:putative transposase